MIVPMAKLDGESQLTTPPPYNGRDLPAGESHSSYQTPPLPGTANRSISGPVLLPVEDDVGLAAMGRQYQQKLMGRCAQGDHSPKRRYGVFGIIMACVLFPIGFICLVCDSEKVCTRCGERLQKT